MLSPARTAAQMRGAVPVASPRPAMTLTAPQARVSMRASEVSIGGRPALSSSGVALSNRSA